MYTGDVRLRILLLLIMEARDCSERYPGELTQFSKKLDSYETAVFKAIDIGDRLLIAKEREIRHTLKAVFDLVERLSIKYGG